MVTYAFNSSSHKVAEFLIHVNRESTGVDRRLFSQLGYPLGCSASVSKNLERLDLALNTKSASKWGWDCQGSCLLNAALAQAQHLKHFAFQICPWIDLSSSFMGELYMLLFDTFPISSWHNLSHLSLIGLHVEIDDLVLFLSALSSIVRRVELHVLTILFRRVECSWETSLRRIKLGCPLMRKKLTIGIGLYPPGERGWIRERVELFFDGGANPFEKKDDKAVDENTLSDFKTISKNAKTRLPH